MPKTVSFYQILQIILGSTSDSMHISLFFNRVDPFQDKVLLLYVAITLNLICVLNKCGLFRIESEKFKRRLHVVNKHSIVICGLFLSCFDFKNGRFVLSSSTINSFLLFVFLFFSIQYILSIIIKASSAKFHFTDLNVEYPLTSKEVMSDVIIKIIEWTIFIIIYLGVIFFTQQVIYG